MAVGDIYTRKTIIPTSEGRTNRNTEAIKKVQQSRGEKEQYAQYERQAIPIKEKSLTLIKNQISQKEQQIQESKNMIKELEEKAKNTKASDAREKYYRRVDEYKDKIDAIEKGINILKKELENYEKITNPLDIISYGTAYSQEVINYASNVESYEKEKAAIKKEYNEERKQIEKKIKSEGGYISGNVAFNKDGSINTYFGESGKKQVEDILKTKFKDNPTYVEGFGLFAGGKLYPTANKDLAQKKLDELNIKKNISSTSLSTASSSGGISLSSYTAIKSTDPIGTTYPIYDKKTGKITGYEVMSAHGPISTTNPEAYGGTSFSPKYEMSTIGSVNKIIEQVPSLKKSFNTISVKLNNGETITGTPIYFGNKMVGINAGGKSIAITKENSHSIELTPEQSREIIKSLPTTSGSKEISSVVSSTSIKEKNKTIEEIMTGKPGMSGAITFKERKMTPAELKANEEYLKTYSELKNLSFGELKNLVRQDSAKQFFFSWKGNKYDPNIVVDLMIEKTNEDLQKSYNEYAGKKNEEAGKIYDINTQNILNNPNLSYEEKNKMLDKEWESYISQIEKNDKEWEEGIGKELLESRKEAKEEFIDKSRWKSVTLPKIVAGAAVGATIGYFLAPAAAGAYGAVGTSIAKGVEISSYVGMGITAASIGASLYNDYQNGTLTKERVLSTVGPSIVILGASVAGGIAGGYAGIAKFKKAQTEFMLNIDKQLTTDLKLQNKVFSSENLKKGYAEIPYGEYKMKIAVNEGMKASYKIKNMFLNKGSVTEKKVVGINEAEKLKVSNLIKEKFKLASDEIYINEKGVSRINAKEFIKDTNIKISDKTLYSVNGRWKGKYTEFIFNVKKNGRITDLYVVVKTPTSVNGLYLARIGKVIMTPTTTKIPVPGSGQPPIEMMSINVKPLGWKLLYGKGIDQSTFQAGNIILDKTTSQIIIKDLKGATRGGEVSFDDFVDFKGVIKIPKQSLGGEEVGKAVTLSQTKKQIEGEGWSLEKEKSMYASKTLQTKYPSRKINIEYTKISPKKTKTEDIFGFKDLKDSIGGEKATPTKAKGTDSSLTKDIFGIENIGKTIKVSKTTPSQDLDIFSGTIPKTKTRITTPKTTTTTAKTKIVPVVGMDLNTQEFSQIGFKPLSKIKEATRTKVVEKPKEEDTFGFKSLSQTLEKTITTPKTTSVQKTSPINKTASTQKSALIQQQKDIFDMQNIFKPTAKTTKTIVKTKPSIKSPDSFWFDFPEQKLKQKKQIKKPKEEDVWDWGFVAEVRRKGKFKPVSKVVSKEEAFLIGEDVVKNTLGASFRVSKANKKIKVKKRPKYNFGWLSDSDFYKKQEGGQEIYIQKREKRLSTKGEKVEIQKSKKKKSNWDLW